VMVFDDCITWHTCQSSSIFANYESIRFNATKGY
jgi:hypothetical protein